MNLLMKDAPQTSSNVNTKTTPQHFIVKQLKLKEKIVKAATGKVHIIYRGAMIQMMGHFSSGATVLME